MAAPSDEEYQRLVERLTAAATTLNANSESDGDTGKNRSTNYKKFASHNLKKSSTPLLGDGVQTKKHKSYSDVSSMRGKVQPNFRILHTQVYSHHESRHYSRKALQPSVYKYVITDARYTQHLLRNSTV